MMAGLHLTPLCFVRGDGSQAEEIPPGVRGRGFQKIRARAGVWRRRAPDAMLPIHTPSLLSAEQHACS